MAVIKHLVASILLFGATQSLNASNETDLTTIAPIISTITNNTTTLVSVSTLKAKTHKIHTTIPVTSTPEVISTIPTSTPHPTSSTPITQSTPHPTSDIPTTQATLQTTTDNTKNQIHPDQPKKSLSGGAVAGIVIVVLVVIAGMGYVLFRVYKAKTITRNRNVRSPNTATTNAVRFSFENPVYENNTNTTQDNANTGHSQC